MNRSELVRLSVVTLVSLLLIGGLFGSRLIVTRSHQQQSRIAGIEAALAEQSFRLTPLGTTLPPGTVAIRYRTPKPGEGSGFYLRRVSSDEALLLRNSHGEPPTRAGTLTIYHDAFVHTGIDGRVGEVRHLDGWEIFELLPRGDERFVQRANVHEPEVADGFMRTDLFTGGHWRRVSGLWFLNKHGGGMPTTEYEESSPKFQRAVNPFSVLGRASDKESAVLEYRFPGTPPQEYSVEARFFLPDKPDIQTGRDDITAAHFLLAQGELDGEQLGFGWWSCTSPTNGTWFLGRRNAAGPWKEIRTWPPVAPPRGNWVRVELEVKYGHIATVSVDGKALGIYHHNRNVQGGFHVHSDTYGDDCQFDDVRVRPRSAAPSSLGSPVFVKSRNFSEKRTFSQQRDPLQFDLWARGRNAYRIYSEPNRAADTKAARICSRMPMYGDFTYRSHPHMSDGKYRFLVVSTPEPQGPLDIIVDSTYVKRGDSWLPYGRDAAASAEFTLEFGRRGSRLFRTRQKQKYYLDHKYDGPAYLMVIPPRSPMLEPEWHHLYSKSIRHDLFEKAPSNWYWHDGGFGMNVRWACQPGWNFMGGKSPFLAAMHSKSSFHGDQIISAFMSLSAVLPDKMQFYIRRDFCISFCYDGRDLDSGYALIFGTDLNRRTVLLKRGRILASTSDPDFLFPLGEHHHAVHWLWWNFECEKTDERLKIRLNDRTIFDVVDPEPIDGGHIGFWTVNNGFTVARVTVSAQKREAHPDVSWRLPSRGKSAWKAVRPETVILTTSGERTRVTNVAGGGPMAVRAYTDVDLAKTPILQLPMELSSDTRVNLHLEIDGRPYIVKIGAPVTWTPFALVPGPHLHGGFTRTMLGRHDVEQMLLGEAAPVNGVLRLDLAALLKSKGISLPEPGVIVMTVGNSSNKGYLMAGFGGNHSGAHYAVGKPAWIRAR